jgi:hypothetical protein
METLVEYQPDTHPETKSKKTIRGDKLTRDRGNELARKRYGRTKVTNGGALLHDVDNRLLWVRRLRDVLAAHLSDIPDASVAERSILRRAGVLTVELERLEAKFAVAGEASAEELDIYARVAGNLRRLLETVGLQRRAKPVEDLYTKLERERDASLAEVVP